MPIPCMTHSVAINEGERARARQEIRHGMCCRAWNGRNRDGGLAKAFQIGERLFFFPVLFFLVPSDSSSPCFIHGGNHMSKNQRWDAAPHLWLVRLSPHLSSHPTIRSPPSLAGLQVPCRLRGSLGLCLRI